MTTAAIPPVLTSLLLSPEARTLLSAVLKSDDVEALATRMHVPKVLAVVTSVLDILSADAVMGNQVDTDPNSILQTQVAEIRQLIDTPGYDPFEVPDAETAVPMKAPPALNFVVRAVNAAGSAYVLIDGKVGTSEFGQAYEAAFNRLAGDAVPVIDIVDVDSKVYATVEFKKAA